MSNAKRPESRQRRNLPKLLDDAAVDVDLPRAPAGLSASLRRSWTALWDSPVAVLLDPVSDLPACRRLYDLYALGDRLGKSISDASDVDTVLVASRLKCATEARLIEAQLGLSPRSRLALGLALLAGRRASSGGVAEHDDADD